MLRRVFSRLLAISGIASSIPLFDSKKDVQEGCNNCCSKKLASCTCDEDEMNLHSTLYLCNYLGNGLEHAEIVRFESRGIWVVPVNCCQETQVLVEWRYQKSGYSVYGIRQGKEVAGSVVANSYSVANSVKLHLIHYNEITSSELSELIELS